MQFTLSKENNRYNTALAERMPALENMLTKHNGFIQQFREDIKDFSDITVSDSTNFAGDYSVDISDKYGFRLERLVLNNEEFRSKMSATGSVSSNFYALYLPTSSEAVITYAGGYIVSYNSAQLQTFIAAVKSKSNNSFSNASAISTIGSIASNNGSSSGSLNSSNRIDDTDTTISPLHTHV